MKSLVLLILVGCSLGRGCKDAAPVKPNPEKGAASANSRAAAAVVHNKRTMEETLLILRRCVRSNAQLADLDRSQRVEHVKKYGFCGELFRHQPCAAKWDGAAITDDITTSVRDILEVCGSHYCPTMAKRSELCDVPPVITADQFDTFIDDVLRVESDGIDQIITASRAERSVPHVMNWFLVDTARAWQGVAATSKGMHTSISLGLSLPGRYCNVDDNGTLLARHCYASKQQCEDISQATCQKLTKSFCVVTPEGETGGCYSSEKHCDSRSRRDSNRKCVARWLDSPR